MSVRLGPKAEYPLIESHFIWYLHSFNNIHTIILCDSTYLAVYGPA